MIRYFCMHEMQKKYLIKIFLLSLSFFLFSNLLFAQDVISDTSSKQILEKDIMDLIKHKKKTSQANDTIHKRSSRTFIPLLYPGYAQVTGFQAVLTSNLSFYTYHGEDAKISSILMNNLYTQYNQIINLINSN